MGSQIQLDSIFQGKTPGPHRKYIGKILKGLHGKYSRFVNPCTGCFTMAQVAVSAGYAPENVYTSDISLFSTVVGYYITGQDLGALDIQVRDERLEKLIGQPSTAAEVLFAIKWCQLQGQNYYGSMFAVDIEKRRDEHLKRLEKDIDQMKANLKGISYKIADMWDVLREEREREDTVLLVNPPGYRKGYTKMFDTKGALTWNEPRIEEFDPKDHIKIYELMMNAPVFFITYRYQNIKEKEYRKHAIYGYEYTIDRVDYWLANRHNEVPKTFETRKRTEIKKSSYPVLPPNYEIREDSVILYESCSAEIALYYRDLFAHRLGATKSERYYLALVDGYVWSVFGIHEQSYRLGLSDYLFEIFGFSAYSAVYKRLNKLFMMTLVSNDAKKSFLAEIGLVLRDPIGVRTTCITPYPELKVNRGVLDLVEREKMKDGRFKIVYQADFNDMSFQDCVKEWYRRGHGKVYN